VLLKKGDAVIVENPGYQPAWEAFESANAKLIPIDVDKDGIVVNDVENQLSKNRNVRAIYLTPHHQYPTTVTLSLQRRLRLVELANKYNITIIEDDYDHEFHFDKRPIAPISSHTELKNYVYVGTFSKIIAPAVRIGYMASSYSFINKVASLRKIIDVQSDTIMELSLVELIKNGDVKRHIKRATKYYEDKRLYLDNLLQLHLKEKIIYNFPSGGSAFWICPKNEFLSGDLTKKLRESDIEIKEATNYSFEKYNEGFRLGYGSVEKDDLMKAIIKLRELL
jgi:GntR family transcriptional regulator/MocR family aminotransferase